jgi:hypothetical protein
MWHGTQSKENQYLEYSMLDSLKAVATSSSVPCNKCKRQLQLHLEFSFAFGATGGRCTVKDAFMPDKPSNWTDPKGQEVTYCPFLVITETSGNEMSAWLPYWHIVKGSGKKKDKYGQWAPFMDLTTFEELLKKAKAKGYFRSL